MGRRRGEGGTCANSFRSTGLLHVKPRWISIKGRKPLKCTELCRGRAAPVGQRHEASFAIPPTRLASTWRNFTGFIEKRFTNCFGAELLTFLPTAAHAKVTLGKTIDLSPILPGPPCAGGDRRRKTYGVDGRISRAWIEKKPPEFVRAKKLIVIPGLVFDMQRAWPMWV